MGKKTTGSQGFRNSIEGMGEVLTQAHRIERDFVVAESRGMRELIEKIKRIAQFRTTVLIQGESGTGKDLLARLLHVESPLRNQPCVNLNCAALPASLIESELFGFTRGAFSGAMKDKRGYFEEARGGTLILDEVSEFPIELQAKLLRVLQEGTFRKLGDTQEIRTDARIVVTTSKDLESEARAGRFREDLLYRLNVLPLWIPPLRERREDILPLVLHFVGKHTRNGIEHALPDGAEEKLIRYGWPGNVRELENVIERAVILSQGRELSFEDWPRSTSRKGSEFSLQLPGEEVSIKRALAQVVPQVESELIRRALKLTGNNRTRAAKLLEISHRSLLYKLKSYNCG